MQTKATKCDAYAKCVMHLKSLITNVIMAFNAFHLILSKLFTSRVLYNKCVKHSNANENNRHLRD